MTDPTALPGERTEQMWSFPVPNTQAPPRAFPPGALDRMIDRVCRCGHYAASVNEDCEWHYATSAKYAEDLLWIVQNIADTIAEADENLGLPLMTVKSIRTILFANADGMKGTVDTPSL